MSSVAGSNAQPVTVPDLGQLSSSRGRPVLAVLAALGLLALALSLALAVVRPAQPRTVA